MIKYLLLLALTGCTLPLPTTYRFDFQGPPEHRQAFEQAIAEWNACGSIHATVSNVSAPSDIPVTYSPTMSDPTHRGETHHDPPRITYTNSLNYKHIFAHELGHLYAGNNDHAKTGLMASSMSASDNLPPPCDWIQR